MEQVSEGPFQQMFYPQMVPCCFVAPPEFCEGMYVPPLGGYEAAWPQGVHRFPQKRQGRQSRNYGAPRLPKTFDPSDFGSPSIWPHEDFGSQEPVTVELSSLPAMLCNRSCLEAAIEQAGLENDVQNLEFTSGDSGEAVLLLANERAAQRCIQHFHGLQWAKSSQPVSARYRLQQQPEQQQQAPESLEKEPTDEKDCATPLTMTPKSTPKLSPKSSIMLSPKSSIMSSPSMKPRWADLDSDDENDDIVSKSTRTGTWDSVPGSSDSGEASNSEQD